MNITRTGAGTTATTATSTATSTASTARLGRRLVELLLAAMVVVVAVLAGGQAAHAARPGVFNYVQCIPGSQVIDQDIEAYRSSANEYVVLRGALVNRATGATYYSQWAVGTGSTAHAAVRYYPVPRGSFNVFYQWAVWDGARGQWVYSGWVQVTGAGLNTYGTETFPGSHVYIGGSSGHCTI
jgi:hypothetical protein